jgi:peptidyl-prolyl cis-trans isomerase B (cyclophilin B)
MPTLPRTLVVLAACLALAGVSGCGTDEGGQAATPTATTTPEDTGGEQQTGCATARQPPAKHVRLPKPDAQLDPSKTYVATVSTNCGEFQITLDAERAPKTAGSFKYLADNGFYDGTTFHRIVPGFVIQGGDPLGTGTGGPGFSVVERPPRNLAYTRGVVAMAKTELERPGTSGSQFFIVTGEDASLPPDYALVGTVTSGEDVVGRIAFVPRRADDHPVDPIVIQKVRVKVS